MTLDEMSNSPFVSTSKYKGIWKENLVVNQTSLSAFFPHIPSIIAHCKIVVGGDKNKACVNSNRQQQIFSFQQNSL